MLFRSKATLVQNYLKSPKDAKLNFARKMVRLDRIARTADTADERALAKFEYELGRMNSFIACWALTRYSDGCIYGEDFYITDYWPESSERVKSIITESDALARFQDEVGKIKAQDISDEAKAKIELAFFNLATIVKRYPKTTTAASIRYSCDHWRDWL